jgi:hypothetical protein
MIAILHKTILDGVYIVELTTVIEFERSRLERSFSKVPEHL